MIGKIAVSAAVFAIDKPYSYRVPEGMELQPGHRVQVPFGRGNKMAEGIVLSLEPGDENGLKSIQRVLEEEPLLTAGQLRLAAFLRERYFCTFFDAIRAMLPAGAWFHTRALFSLTEDRSWKTASIRKEGALSLLQRLEELGGQAEETALEDAVPSRTVFEDAISYLLRKKWISSQQEFHRRVSDKTEKVVTLAVPVEQAMEFAAARPRSAALQRSALELLCSLGSAAAKDVCYYTGATLSTLKRLEELGYVTFSERPVLRCREIRPAEIHRPLVLNPEQQRCFEGLSAQMESEKPGVALLYGITGSGKTSVYIQLIQKCLEDGKSALLLVPEIALTPQLLGLMAAWFGETVAILHSSLGLGERYDQWKRVRAGEARVIVGTRSAVFAPSTDLGLIILDEEQEHSYKSENSPRYSAKEVAIWRGVKENAMVLLGSATPSVESMYRAKTGDYSLYTLKERYNGRPLPEVEIVDMREEVKLGNDLSLSDSLRQAIYDNWSRGDQTVLLLNRRGNSRAMLCVDCRETPECPRCSIPMTYHSANGRLMCHYCGFSQPAPQRCPKCGGPMKTMGTGTQKVEQELLELFPDMAVDRMDADTVSAVNTHEKILEHFQKENVPVLLGTQMVAKGLNLPRVTLVGVLDADLSLYTGGYRAGETTFNLLTQVVGRAGRGERTGRAVIQTMVPGHQLIRLAAMQDYDGFYEMEIRLRQVQNAPPFGDQLMITFQGEDEAGVLRGAVKFRDSLIACLAQPRYRGQQGQVLGPAPCPVPKINYHYRYRLTVNCRMTRPLRQLIAWLLMEFGKDKQNRGISAFADVNGFE
ncbi:MAG: primosomal protein N' [Firmicutes bacterium]|nr:primosomal protein N' [Bacillota bacterium]MDY6161187.1 primosomal protein N' [Candidatus Faecousia sp.]